MVRASFQINIIFFMFLINHWIWYFPIVYMLFIMIFFDILIFSKLKINCLHEVIAISSFYCFNNFIEYIFSSLISLTYSNSIFPTLFSYFPSLFVIYNDIFKYFDIFGTSVNLFNKVIAITSFNNSQKYIFTSLISLTN